MTFEQESQLADFSRAISHTAQAHPTFKVPEILEHAWAMTKQIYSYLTARDRKLFLKYIDLSKLNA